MFQLNYSSKKTMFKKNKKKSKILLWKGNKKLTFLFRQSLSRTETQIKIHEWIVLELEQQQKIQIFTLENLNTFYFTLNNNNVYILNFIYITSSNELNVTMWQMSKYKKENKQKQKWFSFSLQILKSTTEQWKYSLYTHTKKRKIVVDIHHTLDKLDKQTSLVINYFVYCVFLFNFVSFVFLLIYRNGNYYYWWWWWW